MAGRLHPRPAGVKEAGDGVDPNFQIGYSFLVNYADIITIEPGKRSGKPCIRGLRITVYDILEYLAAGMS